MNRIIKYFKSKSVQSIVYAAILILILIVAVGFFTWSLIFLIQKIDSVIIGEKEEDIEISSFNLQKLKAIAPKLNIPF